MIEVSCQCGHTAPIWRFNSEDPRDHTYTCPECNLAWNRLHYFKKLWLKDREFRKKFHFKISQSKLFNHYTELDWTRHAKLERQLKAETGQKDD